MIVLISYRVLSLRATASWPQRLLRIRQINRVGATKLGPKSFRIAPKAPATNPYKPSDQESHARCFPCRGTEQPSAFYNLGTSALGFFTCSRRGSSAGEASHIGLPWAAWLSPPPVPWDVLA